MSDTSAGGKKKSWIWALLAALVVVALGVWWFNRSQDASERSEEFAADPQSQMDANTVEQGQPGVPAGTNAAALANQSEDQDMGNAGAILEADEQRGRAVGPNPQYDAQPGVPGGPAAPPATGSDARPVTGGQNPG